MTASFSLPELLTRAMKLTEKPIYNSDNLRQLKAVDLPDFLRQLDKDLDMIHTILEEAKNLVDKDPSFEES